MRWIQTPIVGLMIAQGTFGATVVKVGPTEVLSLANSQTRNIKYYGATTGSGSDNSAIASAATANKLVVIPAGVFDITSNYSTAIDSTYKFEHGSTLRIASGVTLTINGGIDANPQQQIFDFSLGGSVVFRSGGDEELPEVWVGWFGASGNGVSGDDSTLALTKAFASIPVSFGPTLRLSQGTYITTAGLTVKNGMRVKGQGGLATTISCKIASHSAIGMTVNAESQDVVLEGFTLRNGMYGGVGAWTNSIGLKFSTDIDRPIVRDVKFVGWRLNAFQSLDCQDGLFDNCFFISNDNHASTGGNGLTNATAIWTTNVFSSIKFRECKFTANDADIWIDSYPGLSGNIKFDGCDLQQTGKTNETVSPGWSVRIVNVADVVAVGFRMEYVAGWNGFGAITLDNVKTFTYAGGVIALDQAGIISGNKSILLTNCGPATISGVQFNNTAGFFIWETNAVAGTHTIAKGNWWDLGSGGAYISDANILSRISTNVYHKLGDTR